MNIGIEMYTHISETIKKLHLAFLSNFIKTSIGKVITVSTNKNVHHFGASSASSLHRYLRDSNDVVTYLCHIEILKTRSYQ